MKIFLFSAFCFLLGACAHTNEKISDLPIRASKERILKTLGQPMDIKRVKGADHWIYKIVIDGRHYTRALIIKDSMLRGKGRLEPYSLKRF